MKELSQSEIRQLPNINEAIHQILKEEEAIVSQREKPIIILKPNQVFSPYDAFFNDFDEDKFIVTRLKSGRYSLKPNLRKRDFLFRGQSKEYPSCIPNVFRKKLPTYIIDFVKSCEFQLALYTHPLVKLMCHGINLCDHKFVFEMNYYGLTQHYGLKSPYLDLTSDIEVAKFFACTDHDDSSDVYYPVTDDKRYGILYYMTALDNTNAFQYKENGRLSTIGLQLFPRSGNQKGFLISFSRDGDFSKLKNTKYKLFRHDAIISYEIFSKMKAGNVLFPKDELSSLADRIIKGNEVSFQSLILNLANNPFDNPYLNKSFLETNGLHVNMVDHTKFNDKEKYIFNENIKNGFWEDFCNKIEFPGKDDNLRKKLKDEMLAVPMKHEYKQYFQFN